jgi:hypothetical protein
MQHRTTSYRKYMSHIKSPGLAGWFSGFSLVCVCCASLSVIVAFGHGPLLIVPALKGRPDPGPSFSVHLFVVFFALREKLWT